MQRPQRPINPKRASLQRLSRRQWATLISADAMRHRLHWLAEQGRRDDCLALMQELGDWQRRDPDAISDALLSPDFRNKKGERSDDHSPNG